MAGKELRTLLSFFLIGIAVLAVQTTWLPRHSFFGSTPDLLLVLVCCLGLSRGISASAFAGLCIGIMLGGLNRHMLITILIWSITGFTVGISNNNVFNASRSLAGVVAAAGTLVMYGLYWTLTALMLKEPFYTTWEIPLLTAFQNGVISYLIFPLFVTARETPRAL